jgi:lysophospholipase L1-like esterase
MKLPTAKKSLLVNLSISVVTLLLCLGGLELVARIWEYNLAKSPLGWELVASRRFQVEPSGNPRINAVLRPNMDYLWEGIPVHINSHGLRDIERNFAKSEGIYRVLSLGDSVAFGWEVRSEDTYAKQLQTLLQARGGPTYEAINAGILGWDLPIELAYLEETGLRYDPDLIIAQCTVANDIYHTIYTIPPPSLARWLRDHTSLWGFLSRTFWQARDQLQGFVQGTQAGGTGAPSYPFPLDEEDPIWEEYIRAPLLEMAELAQRNDADFVIVVFPTDVQVRSPEYPTTAQQVIRNLGSEYDILVLDLLPVFREAYVEHSPGTGQGETSPLFADFSSHLSVLGHRLAAEAIYKTLEEKGLLPKP